MSPRTDSYLSLCLEQASKSTLHYRHGCIIVRGGKVIGQGHNDYRPRFNGGGTLKTGRLAGGTSNSAAILTLQKKGKSKSNKLDPSKDLLALKLASMETGDVGGGCLANSPLSMHSEMMAIQSALSLSSNSTSHGSARSSALMQKPGSYKLPGRGKRQLRLRNLKDYVNTVCSEAAATQASRQSSGMQRRRKGQVQWPQFEASAPQCGQREVHELQQCGGRGDHGGECERTISHSEKCCVRPPKVFVCSSARVPELPSGPPPPHSRHDTTTRTTRVM